VANPLITPTSPGQDYSVAGSKRVHGSFDLATNAGNVADFTVVFPVTVSPTVVLRRTGSQVLTLPANPAQVGAIDAFTITWVTNDAPDPMDPAVTLRTLTVTVEDPSASLPLSPWTIEVDGLAEATTRVTAGAEATVTIVEADPVIVILTPNQTGVEGGNVPLQAQAGRNTHPLAVGGCGEVALTWAQDLADPIAVASLTPLAPVPVLIPNPAGPGSINGCQREVTVGLPALSADATFQFTMTAAAGVFTNGEPASIDASTRTRYAVLALDRSGSMSAANKWVNAGKAAHMWLDIVIALRSSSVDDRVGVLVFEDPSCSFRADNDSVAGVVDISFPAAGALGTLAAADQQTINLGPPGGCTPIGDALIRSLERMDPLPGDAAQNLYGILLLTDGLENAGTVKIDNDVAPPAGVELFQNRRLDFAKFKFPGDVGTTNTHLYTIGMGTLGTVNEQALDDLANSIVDPPGYYNLISDPREVMDGLAEMAADFLGGQRIPVGAAALTALSAGDVGATNVGYFPVAAGEDTLVVLVPWDPVGGGITDAFELRWRLQNVPEAPFQVVPVAALTMKPSRASHGVAIVDVSQVTAQDSEWRVQYLPAGVVGPFVPENVLAIVDLRVSSMITFDRRSYRTGQAMKISARLREGARPVTGASVTVQFARPGESLGTFLGVNSQSVQPASTPSPGDTQLPKQAALAQILRRLGLKELPVLTPAVVFADGSNQLLDDGAHDDGAGGDGVYANRYVNTDMEGTYRFRFFVQGQTSTGGQYRHLMTRSRWVGVNVDPSASTTVLEQLGVEDGIAGLRVILTPRDSNGQLFGPYRPGKVTFTVNGGTLSGPVQDRLDGSYAQVIHYPAGGGVPEIEVDVDGTSMPVPGSGTAGKKPLWLWILIVILIVVLLLLLATC
jgi:hypothetical protein